MTSAEAIAIASKTLAELQSPEGEVPISAFMVELLIRLKVLKVDDYDGPNGKNRPTDS
jgi:hypothetical protein